MYEDYEDEIYEFPELEQHTPGPWKVNSDGMGTVMCWNGNGDLQPLTKVLFQNFETEEAYANARLIAAAPELARILKKALPYMKESFEANAIKDCAEKILKTALEP